MKKKCVPKKTMVFWQYMTSKYLSKEVDLHNYRTCCQALQEPTPGEVVFDQRNNTRVNLIIPRAIDLYITFL